MKRITVAAFFTLASILGVGTAFAQSHEVQATVPFNFAVGSRVLPAGTYTLAPAMDGAIEIQNREAHIAVLAQGSNDSRPSAGCALSFDRRAGQYFMRGILCNSAAMNVSLPSSKLEKRVRVEEARLHKNDGRVLVAAR